MAKNLIEIPYWDNNPKSEPLPKQLLGHRADYRYRMLSGAVRAGKSVWGSQEGIKLSFKWPKNRGAIIRSTLTELKRTTQVTFFQIFGCNSDSAHHPAFKKWNKSEQHLRFINDSDLFFVGVENWKILGSLELGWVFVEEGVDIDSEALKFLRTRLSLSLPYPDYSNYFFTATNPGDENHILYKWFIKPPETDEEKEDRKRYWCIFTTSYDNIYLADSYKKEIDSWKSDIEFYNRYALGKWGRFKGLVYKEYDENVHLVKEEKYAEFMARIKEFYTATDWGFTNPAAILFLGVTGDKEVILFDEIYETEKTNPQLRALYSDKCELHKISSRQNYCDPAEPSDIKEFNDNGISSVAADNDIEAGIKKVKEYLMVRSNNKPELYVFERCVNVRKEFRLYRRPTDDEVRKNKNLPELPIDKDNHALSALRYFINTHFKTDSKLQTYSKTNQQIPDDDPVALLKRRRKAQSS